MGAQNRILVRSLFGLLIFKVFFDDPSHSQVGRGLRDSCVSNNLWKQRLSRYTDPQICSFALGFACLEVSPSNFPNRIFAFAQSKVISPT